MVVQEVIVFCFGCYGREQYLSWVVHQAIVRASNRYFFRMKDIFYVFSNMWLLLCYLRAPIHQHASPLGFHVGHIPKGNIYIICIYLEYMYLSLPTRRKQPIGPKHELDSALTRPRGGQATNTSRQKNSERYAEPFGGFSVLFVGLHGPGWRHVLGMPPPWLLVHFRDFDRQSTCHGPRSRPKFSPWCSGGHPAFPGAETKRNDPGPEEKKNADVQKEKI